MTLMAVVSEASAQVAPLTRNRPNSVGRARRKGFFAVTRPGHWLCDLAGLARHRLLAAGVGSVHGGGFDTRTDDRFYSYRRDGAQSGRFASLVWLTP